RQLKEKKRIPDLPIYVNSPMAISATEIFRRHPKGHKISAHLLTDHSLNPLECGNLHFVREASASKQLNLIDSPKIVIAGSGMAEGGRILHHLKTRLPQQKNTIIFVGFQAEGTRGRALTEGAKTVKIHGQNIPVRARIELISSLSGHSDLKETLGWLGSFERQPRRTFIVHGEKTSAENQQKEIQSRLGWKTSIPKYGESFELT
ncbi:MAG: MBL fold metallo-hydrolase RNA specificity domain-containing protein, partial [bacterium]|nr:MBL fold metallo-hydrolase RNA specificity domain-containing protein [bacterium]